jgi:hypothetical protein
MRRRLGLLIALWLAPAARAETTYVPSGSDGRLACGALAPGWQAPGADDSAWLGPQVSDGGVSCVGTLYGRWRFAAGDERARLALLSLRIRYQDGFAAYLNGVEIARRRLDPTADAAAPAVELHGPEAERLFVAARPDLLRAGDNLLAVEVHARTPLRTPSVEVELSGSEGPRIVRGPYLLGLAEREVTVVFETDLPTVGEVRWGASEAYGAVTSENSPSLHHVLALHRLRPATVYHYRATVRARPAALALVDRPGSALPLDDGSDAGDAVFHTPPAAGRPLRFVVYGDVRSGHDVHAQLVRALGDEDPDLALLTGDLVDRGSDEGDWERFFEIAGPLLKQVGIFPVPGNHEYFRLGRGAAAFFALFRAHPVEDDPGYYSFDRAGVHFVALDSNQYRSPRQLAWLDQDLAQARRRGARALFVYAHEGAWSTGIHGDNQVVIRDYVPVMQRHRVAMFFSGHDHDYERGRIGGLDYVVTGGGGAELRPPRCGVPPLRPCPPHVQSFANEHHYVLVEVLPSFFRVCAKRPDGSALEPCVRLPLRR